MYGQDMGGLYESYDDAGRKMDPTMLLGAVIGSGRDWFNKGYGQRPANSPIQSMADVDRYQAMLDDLMRMYDYQNVRHPGGSTPVGARF